MDFQFERKTFELLKHEPEYMKTKAYLIRWIRGKYLTRLSYVPGKDETLTWMLNYGLAKNLELNQAQEMLEKVHFKIKSENILILVF
jgi:hypothetical protein